MIKLLNVNMLDGHKGQMKCISKLVLLLQHHLVFLGHAELHASTTQEATEDDVTGQAQTHDHDPLNNANNETKQSKLSKKQVVSFQKL